MEDPVNRDGRVTSHDFIRQTRAAVPTFNQLWLKNGAELLWIQRIGFALLSFFLFSVGLLAVTLMLSALIHEDQFVSGVFEVLLLPLFILGLLLPGVLGLRNVLRFPTSDRTSDSVDESN